MKHNFKRVRISRDDYELSYTAVQSFCGLVGTFLDLLEGGALRD